MRAPEGWVAIILAIGLALALDLLVAGVLYEAITGDGDPLSDRGAQAISAIFGGVLGILGAFLGYRAGRREPEQPSSPQAERGQASSPQPVKYPPTYR